MAHIQHVLGGIGRAVLLMAIIVVVVAVAWRAIMKIVRLGVIRAIGMRV